MSMNRTTGRTGGNTDQMRVMGNKFNAEADQLEALVQRVTQQLNSTEWEGGAAERFQAQWNGPFQKVFREINAGLRECASEVTKRAEGFQQVGG